jgi:hypothetical protein
MGVATFSAIAQGGEFDFIGLYSAYADFTAPGWAFLSRGSTEERSRLLKTAISYSGQTFSPSEVDDGDVERDGTGGIRHAA